MSNRSARRWVFLFARNYGDALIGRELVSMVCKAHPSDSVDVLTREEFRAIFLAVNGVRGVYTSTFPMGNKRKQFGLGALLRFLWVAFRIRERGCVDVFVDTSGDLREALIGVFLGGASRVSPDWSLMHPYRKTIITSKLFTLATLRVPIDEALLNVYSVHRAMGRLLGCVESDLMSEMARAGRGREIGVHPFATQACRVWPWPYWCLLIELLLARGYNVKIFGSMGERQVLLSQFARFASSGGVAFCTGSMADFFDAIGNLRVLIALDSFAIHAAYAMRVPAVMINGGNDHRIWAPPGTRVVSNGAACGEYPCYCLAPCVGNGEGEYICIKGIVPAAVLCEVEALIFS